MCWFKTKNTGSTENAKMYKNPDINKAILDKAMITQE